MYITDEEWAEYYNEIEPEKRGKILEDKGDDGGETVSLIRRLYELRYLPDGADMMLRVFLDILSVQQTSFLFFKHNIKNIKKSMDRAGFGEALSRGESGRKALYFEIRNGMGRYLKTCEGESYGAAFSGLIKISREKQKEKTREDLLRMTYGFLPDGASIDVEDFNEYHALLCEAVKDEYLMRTGEELGIKEETNE